MANLGRGSHGVHTRTGSIYTGVGGQLVELCAGKTSQVLTVLWDGTVGWTDPTPAGPEILNDLNDVNAPDPCCGDIIYYDGSQWINHPLKAPAFEFFMGQL